MPDMDTRYTQLLFTPGDGDAVTQLDPEPSLFWSLKNQPFQNGSLVFINPKKVSQI